MAKIAILLPRAEMISSAQEMARRYQLDLMSAVAVKTSAALKTAEEMIEGGADIIIARGIQAMIIKQNTSIPIIEARLTGQEMALLLKEAIQLANSQRPHIAIVGFRNMFCDMTQFSKIFGVRLELFYVDNPGQIPHGAQKAMENGADVLIGGDMVCGCAAANHVPSVFISSTSESVGEACRIAQHMAYAIDQEQSNTAQFKAILDYTVSGIIQVDGEGTVLHMNHAAEQMSGILESTAMGQPIHGLIPALDYGQLQPVLQDGKEIYAAHIHLQETEYSASVTPVLMEEAPAGAIVCIYEGKQMDLYAAKRRSELILQGFLAPYTFETMVARSPQAKALLEQGLHYAKFDLPVLLLGEFGTEKEELAQCIHNASIYGKTAFVSLNCGGYSQQEAELRLFGRSGEDGSVPVPGLVDKAQGILFLNEISQLSLSAQYKVYRLIVRDFNSSYGGLEPSAHSLRLIAADSRDLAALVQEGAFREDLYYALSMMTLHIPPLRQRREDILGWSEYFLRELQNRHSRYLHLTKGAWQLLLDQNWDGNLAQLRNVCERLIVCAPRRNVDEGFLAQLLEQAAPVLSRTSQPTPVAYQDPKAAHIAHLLKKHGGRRAPVARELNISTTTLWRYIKKYGVEWGD